MDNFCSLSTQVRRIENFPGVCNWGFRGGGQEVCLEFPRPTFSQLLPRRLRSFAALDGFEDLLETFFVRCCGLCIIQSSNYAARILATNLLLTAPSAANGIKHKSIYLGINHRSHIPSPPAYSMLPATDHPL